jgi:hypothetical protein
MQEKTQHLPFQSPKLTRTSIKKKEEKGTLVVFLNHKKKTKMKRKYSPKPKSSIPKEKRNGTLVASLNHNKKNKSSKS